MVVCLRSLSRYAAKSLLVYGWPVQDGIAGAVVAHLTAFKHKDLVRDLGHHREIMADKDNCQSELHLQPRQKLQHLRLDRYIKRHGKA